MLCNTCAHLDVRSFFTEEKGLQRSVLNAVGASPDAVNLGQLHDVHERSFQCNFCRIVFEAVQRRGSRVSWLTMEWLLNRSRSLGTESQCLLYSYRFANTLENDSIADQGQGYRLAIALRPLGSWPAIANKAGEIVLVDTTATASNAGRTLQGRIMQLDRVNVTLAKRWLRICEMEHGRSCEVPGDDLEKTIPDSRPVNLIVIDVQNKRLCKLPEDG